MHAEPRATFPRPADAVGLRAGKCVTTARVVLGSCALARM
jgi:hypothetical protein